MPYISLDNLTQYNDRLREYLDATFDKLDGANWRKTSAAQSVTCYPIPETALEPEVSFLFSETPPESGTKGPNNPSTINGVESVSCHVCESEGVDDTPYSINLGGTYYGGTVNFATGVLEVTHHCFIFNGTENWVLQQSYSNVNIFCYDTYTASLRAVGGNNENHICSHYNRLYSWGSDTEHFYVGTNSTIVNIFSVAQTLDAFKSFLATQYLNGTPVTVVFELETPKTVPLTPVLVRSLPALSHYTPRQNTIYTPHESVQVGYAKSASKTSQDLANAIVALGGNI